MYKEDENNVDSYFQIAGIHGLPYIPWDNATSDEGWNARSDARNAWGGYCVHGSVLFPTWHRPYISLFEVRNTIFSIIFGLISFVFLASHAETCCANCGNL